jgi:hypothetical protein
LDEGLMARLESRFTTEEQQGLFLKSFSAHLNYQPIHLVISLDDVWNGWGFHSKGTAKNGPEFSSRR